MAETGNILDILVKGEKKGEAFDLNPVLVTTDIECKKILLDLRSSLKLSTEQGDLIDRCVSVVSAKDDEEVPFGPLEIIALSELAQANSERAAEILACSQHLSESVDCDGELPPGVFLGAAMAYGALSKVMAAALRSGPIIPGQTPLLDDDVSDEDFEEELSDNEENQSEV